MTAQAAPPPSIPRHGAYLGAWVNPNNSPQGPRKGQIEIKQLPLFQAQVGRPMAILHVFIPFNYDDANESLLLAVLDEIEASGATPMIDLDCQSVDSINAGLEDGTIRTLATTLARYRKPLFLRWYWEMNSPKPTCGSYDYPNRYTNFVSAWRRLHGILRTVAPSASNVALVWCPLSRSSDRDFYYPGDPYVDWIAADAFYRQHKTDPFHNLFNDWYTHYYTAVLLAGKRPKPLMIAATGATPLKQPQFLQNIQQTLPTAYPGVKAMVYFDAPGMENPPGENLVLVGSGLAAFRTLAATPYFSYVDTNADVAARGRR